MKKRYLALAAAAALFLAMPVLASEAGPLGEPRELGEETVVAVINSEEVSPLVIPYTGYFNGTMTYKEDEEVPADAETRTYKLYIPENYRMKTYQIVMNVPDGMAADQFLVESGWKDLADKEEIMIRVLEPGAAGWGAESDLDYVTRVMGQNNGIPTFAYLVGYGVGGSILQQYTMANAANYGACAFIDASEGIAPEYMADMANHHYMCNPGREDSLESYAFNELPMPIWFVDTNGITEEEQAVIDYWKVPGDIQEAGEEFYDGQIYSQGEAYNYLTPIENVTKIAITSDEANATPENIYGFLKNYIRYGGTSLGSNSLFRRPDYKELGVVEDYVMSSDDIRRDFLIYRPESVNPDEEAPLVFTLHGSGSGHYMEFDASDWWQVADANGFIVVSVNGTVSADPEKPVATGRTPGIGWPGIPDADTFKLIIAKVEEDGFKVDHKRIYAHGQSAGGMGVRGIVNGDPYLFAAAGTTTNACTFQVVEGNDPKSMPGMFSLVGEFDNGKFSMAEKDDKGEPTFLANLLRARGFEWEEGAYGGEVMPPTVYEEVATYNTYRWKDEAGHTLYEFAVVQKRGHSMKADNCWKMWEEFSKYSRDDEGNLLENGERIFE